MKKYDGRIDRFKLTRQSTNLQKKNKKRWAAMRDRKRLQSDFPAKCEFCLSARPLKDKLYCERCEPFYKNSNIEKLSDLEQGLEIKYTGEPPKVPEDVLSKVERREFSVSDWLENHYWMDDIW